MEFVQRSWNSVMIPNYKDQIDKMPPICPAEKADSVKQVVLDKLQDGELMYLSTLSPTGWPVTDCMHYVSVEGENKQPIIYMFTHNHVRKLENIAKDSRVSVSVCHAVSFERRNETWAFQFMGTASRVLDPDEIKQAVSATRAKKGYEFAAKLPLETQPCIRIDPLYGAFMSGDSDPAACSIEYQA